MFVGSARATPLAASSGVAVRMRCSIGARGVLDIDVAPALEAANPRAVPGLPPALLAARPTCPTLEGLSHLPLAPEPDTVGGPR